MSGQCESKSSSHCLLKISSIPSAFFHRQKLSSHYKWHVYLQWVYAPHLGDNPIASSYCHSYQIERLNWKRKVLLFLSLLNVFEKKKKRSVWSNIPQELSIALGINMHVPLFLWNSTMKLCSNRSGTRGMQRQTAAVEERQESSHSRVKLSVSEEITNLRRGTKAAMEDSATSAVGGTGNSAQVKLHWLHLTSFKGCHHWKMTPKSNRETDGSTD